MVIIEENGSFQKVDTINYDNNWWLVPEWYDNKSKGWIMPKRIIQLDSLPHQVIDSGNPVDFVLDNPMPKDVFDGKTKKHKSKQFCVLIDPEIKLPRHFE
jgi:hypothetical protein